MKPIRVLLVDSEEVFREGLSRLLREQPCIEVVGQCGSGAEAVAMTGESKPDIVLLDGELAGCCLTEMVQEIRNSSSGVKVVVINRREAKFTPVDMIRAGAHACLSKSITIADLVKALELISSGRIIISRFFAEKFFAEVASLGSGSGNGDDLRTDSGLSDRELEVVKLVAEGATSKEIAQKLTIAENTVKVHIRKILDKVELRNRQQLVAHAVLRRWVIVHSKPPD